MDKLTNNITNNIPKTDLKSSHKTINDVASGKVSDTSVSDNIVDINTTKKIVSEMAASAPIDADKVATIGSLKVYKNPNLASVSFDGISAPAAAYTGTSVIWVGATTASNVVTAGTANTSNKLFAQSIVETAAVDLADGSDRATATITTNSGLADLAAMIVAAKADTKNDVAVFFDNVDSYTTKAGVTTTDETGVANAKATIANFSTDTVGTADSVYAAKNSIGKSVAVAKVSPAIGIVQEVVNQELLPLDPPQLA